MFRRLTMAIFRLYMKYLVRSYTRLILGCIQLGGGRRGGHEISHVSWRLGGVGTWGDSAIVCMSKLILLGLWYHIVCVVE